MNKVQPQFIDGVCGGGGGAVCLLNVSQTGSHFWLGPSPSQKQVQFPNFVLWEVEGSWGSVAETNKPMRDKPCPDIDQSEPSGLGAWAKHGCSLRCALGMGGGRRKLILKEGLGTGRRGAGAVGTYQPAYFNMTTAIISELGFTG